MEKDEELVTLLAVSDGAAFTQIYEMYWEKLLAIAYAHTKDKSDAEEIVQEVFLSLWNRREQVNIQSLENYLAKAVKFATFKKIMRTHQYEDIYSISYKGQYESLEEQIDAVFLKEYLEGVVDVLPARCRLIFKYSREDHKTNKEIAQELSISEKAVEANITRALKKIRFQLKKGWFLVLTIFLYY